jgi:hypothetical protein
MMKTISLMTLAGLAVFFVFPNPRAYGQAEINPDHYETSDSAAYTAKASPAIQPARLHYEGNFTLPHDVKCEGKSLHPGAYVVSLDSDGTTVKVTLNLNDQSVRKDQAVRIETVPQRQARYRGQDAVVVERSGDTRQLSAIHIAQLDLVFPLSEASQAAGGGQSIERLPVQSADSR